MSHGLTKQTQWKRAAIVIAWVVENDFCNSETGIRLRAETALRTLMPTAPWEYPWSEVVRSVRERSGHK